MVKAFLNIFSVLILTGFSTSAVYSMKEEENKTCLIIVKYENPLTFEELASRSIEGYTQKTLEDIARESIDLPSLQTKFLKSTMKKSSNFPKDKENSEIFNPLFQLIPYDLEQHGLLVSFIFDNRENLPLLAHLFECLPLKKNVLSAHTKKDFSKIISILKPQYTHLFEQALYSKKLLKCFEKADHKNSYFGQLPQKLKEGFDSLETQSILFKFDKIIEPQLMFCNSVRKLINNPRSELEKAKRFYVEKIQPGINVVLKDPFKHIGSLIIAAGVIFPDFQNTPFFTIAISALLFEEFSFLYNFLYTTYEDVYSLADS